MTMTFQNAVILCTLKLGSDFLVDIGYKFVPMYTFVHCVVKLFLQQLEITAMQCI